MNMEIEGKENKKMKSKHEMIYWVFIYDIKL